MPVAVAEPVDRAGYGRFPEQIERDWLGRWCHRSEADVSLIRRRDEEATRLGFAAQLVTVRAIGTFLADPTAVPAPIVASVARQLDIVDPVVLTSPNGRATWLSLPDAKRPDGDDVAEPAHAGEQLQALRLAAGMTVGEVSERVGVDVDWLRRLEAGDGTHDVLYSQWTTLVRATQPPRPEWWDEGYEHDLSLPPDGHREPTTDSGRRYWACVAAVAAQIEEHYSHGFEAGYTALIARSTTVRRGDIEIPVGALADLIRAKELLHRSSSQAFLRSSVPKSGIG